MARVSGIDDDDDTREVIRDLLENDGYVVDDVTTASSALDRLLTLPDPMFVLFDYLLPEMTGADLVGAAECGGSSRRHRAYVCVTASPTRLPASFVSWLRRHHAPLVTKPFDVDELLTCGASVTARLQPVH